MTVPYWVQDAVFYQIFPDRFANGDVSIDPVNTLAWDLLPTSKSFHGGDLRGIIQKFDYLLDLGINAIYLNPIFLSPSNHRYNATDYLQIDPKLGNLQDFHALLDVAHHHDVRIILDGVFNHCGRGFFAFSDVLENQEYSPYKDWFHILRYPVDAFSPGDSEDYLGWWKLKSLPKFNTNNPAVRSYLLKVAQYWIEQGADGWRLDVPNEIDDDSFWAEFRHTVQSVNRDAYILGEIWDGNPRWVGDRHFDGLMNYPLRDAMLGLLTEKLPVSQFADKVEKLLSLYPRENVYAMYVSLGTHDTARLITLMGGDMNKVKLAFQFLFAFPGAPAIYYGDEIGLEGGKDPDSRRPFPWDELAWNKDLRTWVQDLIHLRKRLPVLRRGSYQRILINDVRGVYAFYRGLGDEKVLVVMNTSTARRNLRIPVATLGWKDGLIVHNLMDSCEYLVSGEDLSLSINPMTGIWLK